MSSEPRLEECVVASPWEEWHSRKKEQWEGTGEQGSLGRSHGVRGSEVVEQGSLGVVLPGKQAQCAWGPLEELAKAPASKLELLFPMHPPLHMHGSEGPLPGSVSL